MLPTPLNYRLINLMYIKYLITWRSSYVSSEETKRFSLLHYVATNVWTLYICQLPRFRPKRCEFAGNVSNVALGSTRAKNSFSRKLQEFYFLFLFEFQVHKIRMTWILINSRMFRFKTLIICILYVYTECHICISSRGCTTRNFSKIQYCNLIGIFYTYRVHTQWKWNHVFR